jgi:hypothetical protein
MEWNSMPKHLGWFFMGLLALASAGGCAAPLAMAPPPARDPASAQAEEAPLVPRPDLVTGEKVIVQLNRPLEETPMPAGHHHHHGGAAEEAETPEDDGRPTSAPGAGSPHDHHGAAVPQEKRP